MNEKLHIPYEEKTNGNSLFKEGNTEEASKCYSKALLAVNFFLKEHDLDEEQLMSLVNEVQIPCLLNLSACLLRLGHSYRDIVTHCSGVLKIDPSSAKAFYRRAQAQHNLGEDEAALKDITSARSINPKDKLFAELEVKVRASLSRVREKSRRVAKRALGMKNEYSPSLWLNIGKALLSCCKRRFKLP